MDITFVSCDQELQGYLVRFRVIAGKDASEQKTWVTTVVANADAAGLDADGLLARAWRQVEPTLGEEFRVAADARPGIRAVALVGPDLDALKALEGQLWVPPVPEPEEVPEAEPAADLEPAPTEPVQPAEVPV